MRYLTIMTQPVPPRSNASLVERITAAIGKICVLHAPAGFGKTALLDEVKQALSARGAAVVTRGVDVQSASAVPWVILDEEEALSLEAVRFGQILNDAITAHTGIVIAARRIDQLPLARLRAAGHVLSFGPRYIAITKHDARSRLSTAVDKGTAEWLTDMTDGWTIAVTMLLDYAHEPDAAFGEDGDFIAASGLAAYIDQEVLAGLPREWVAALRFASIVETCDPMLLDHIRPDDDLGRHLGALREQLPGLVEGSETGTSLNPMLRLHLQRQFKRLPRHERAQALERASEYCARVGREAEAASLVTQVGRADAIVDFVRRSEGLRIWVTAGTDVIRKIVSQAGVRGIQDEPRLKLFKSLIHGKDGEIDESERLFNEAVPQLSGDSQAQRDAAIARVVLLFYGCRPVSDADLRAFRDSMLRSGEDPAWNYLILAMQAILEIQRAELDSAVSSIAEGMRNAAAAESDYGVIFLTIHRANVELARGELSQARNYLGNARKLWRSTFPGDTGLQTILDAFTASLEFEAGHLSSARNHIRRSGHRLPHVEAWLDVYVVAYETMARLLVDEAGLSSALARLKVQQDALAVRGLPRIGRLVGALATCLAGEAILRGEIVEFAFEAPDAEGQACWSWQEREIFSLAGAYAAIAGKQPEIAVRALTGLASYAEPLGLQRTLLRAWLLLVAAYDRLGDIALADCMFESALELGVRSGMARAFVEFGGNHLRNRCAKKVAATAGESVADPKMLGLLRSIARWVAPAPTKASAEFTPREINVLDELQRGGTDKAIARRLGITEHTVHHHLKNIYRKLGVHDRLGALAKAQRMPAA